MFVLDLLLKYVCTRERIQDFPEGTPTLIIWPNFPANRVKMKKMVSRRGRIEDFVYVDPPLILSRRRILCAFASVCCERTFSSSDGRYGLLGWQILPREHIFVLSSSNRTETLLNIGWANLSVETWTLRECQTVAFKFRKVTTHLQWVSESIVAPEWSCNPFLKRRYCFRSGQYC